MTNSLKHIKGIQNILIILPVIVFLFVLFQANTNVRAQQITLFVESGVVEVLNLDDSSPKFKQVKDRFYILNKNSSVRTNEGRAYLLLPGKSLISLDFHTDLTLNNLTQNTFKLRSEYGRTWHKIKKQSNENSFKYQLSTPNAQLVSFDTEFELNVHKDSTQKSEVALYKGEAVVSNSQSRLTEKVDQGKLATIDDDTPNINLQEVPDEVATSDFTVKNRIIGEEINKLSVDVVSVATYSTIIENVTSTLSSAKSSGTDNEISDTPDVDNVTPSTPATSTQNDASSSSSSSSSSPSVTPVPSDITPPQNGNNKDSKSNDSSSKKSSDKPTSTSQDLNKIKNQSSPSESSIAEPSLKKSEELDAQTIIEDDSTPNISQTPTILSIPPDQFTL